GLARGPAGPGWGAARELAGSGAGGVPRGSGRTASAADHPRGQAAVLGPAGLGAFRIAGRPDCPPAVLVADRVSRCRSSPRSAPSVHTGRISWAMRTIRRFRAYAPELPPPSPPPPPPPPPPPAAGP